MKTIVFDVDGVLANFTRAFTSIGHYFFGTSIVESDEQKSWNFREHLTDIQQTKMWEYLRNYPNWWNTLMPLVPHEVFQRVNALTLKNEVYFLTNRFSNCRPAGEQTLSWLIRQGIDKPRVIVSSRKGEICKAVGADFSLEDNWGNATSIHWMAEGCQSFLIERRYNEEARKVIPKGITVVKTVEEFLNDLDN